jgi:4-methyl-5(b-hydroxyethyl)-thiazole monophosphate biosynthesis
LALSEVARGCRITCHSSVREQMSGYEVVGGNVVEDGNLITGAGAGVSVEFALAVAARLVDEQTLARIKKGMEVA